MGQDVLQVLASVLNESRENGKQEESVKWRCHGISASLVNLRWRVSEYLSITARIINMIVLRTKLQELAL